MYTGFPETPDDATVKETTLVTADQSSDLLEFGIPQQDMAGLPELLYRAKTTWLVRRTTEAGVRGRSHKIGDRES